MKRITLTLTVLWSVCLFSQNLFREDFGTFNTNQTLSGQGNWTNNASSYGLGSCTGSSCTNSSVVQQTVGYLNWGTANRSVVLTPNGDGCGLPFTTQSSGVFYIGFVLRLTDCSYSSYDFIHLSGSTSQTVALKVHVVKTSATQYNVGLSKYSGNIVWSSTPYTFNTNQLILIKYGFYSGSNDDILMLYTNPNINGTEPSLPNALTNSGGDNSTTVDRIILNQMSPNAPTGRIGLFSMAKSWTTLKFSALENTSFTSQDFSIIQNAQSQSIEVYNGAANDYYEMELYSALGQKMWSSSMELPAESITTLPIGNSLSPGIYFLQINNSNKQKVIKKLMVN